MTILLLIVGAVLLLTGAEGMVRGAVALSRRAGLSDLFVGVVIIGFATSSPELFISVDAALFNHPEIAVGNVIGSNIANILLVLGAGAAASALPCRGAAVRRDGAMMAAATVALAIACFAGGFTRLVGVLLIVALGVYIARTFIAAKRVAAAADPGGLNGRQGTPVWQSLIIAAIGLGALLLGAKLVVSSAVALAEGLGVSDRVIAISVIAVGTSLPELATVVVAGRRGHVDMAVGNVLGSCVFNVFGVLGAAALAGPMLFAPEKFMTDVGVMAFAGAALLAMILFARVISRISGIAMLIAYFAYIALLFSSGATA